MPDKARNSFRNPVAIFLAHWCTDPPLSPQRQLKAVHVETFGKTGCRRIVPGQYLAADPQGRAIMISAVEKQKLVGAIHPLARPLG